MSIIVIQLQGGLVQDVFIKGKNFPIKAVIVDEDTEGSDNVTTYTGEDGKKHQACIHSTDIIQMPQGCDMDRATKGNFMKKDKKKLTKKAVKEDFIALMDSCVEGQTGEWDYTSGNGFEDMYILLKRLADHFDVDVSKAKIL